MLHTLHQGVFQYMREGTMADVVELDGCLNGFSLTIEDEIAFPCQ